MFNSHQALGKHARTVIALTQHLENTQNCAPPATEGNGNLQGSDHWEEGSCDISGFPDFKFLRVEVCRNVEVSYGGLCGIEFFCMQHAAGNF